MVRFLRPLAESRTYLATLDFGLDLVFGILWFSLFTTGIAAGASLLITLVGLPILTATFLIARAGGWIERRRAALLLGTEIADPVRRPPKSDGVWDRLMAPFRDR